MILPIGNIDLEQFLLNFYMTKSIYNRVFSRDSFSYLKESQEI